jgi:WD40 repeat protein
VRGAKLLSIGAAIGILLLAAGNFGQVGLSQGQIPPVRTLGFDAVTSAQRAAHRHGSWQVIRTFEGHTGSIPWRSAPTGGSSPPAPRTRRSSCGRWPQEEKCAPSKATPGVTSVAFSPDGQAPRLRLRDKTIKLWEVATGREVRTLKATPTECHFRGVQPRREAPRLRLLGRDDQAVGHQRSFRKVR